MEGLQLDKLRKFRFTRNEIKTFPSDLLILMPNLKELGLQDCGITDVSSVNGPIMKQLKTLSFYDNDVKDVTPLKKLMPNATIAWDY